MSNEAMEWISVKDKLPIPDTKINSRPFKAVLIWGMNKAEVALYYDDTGFHNAEILDKYESIDRTWGYDIWKESITHWMPIVKPVT